MGISKEQQRISMLDAHLTKPLELEKIRKAIQEFAEKPAGANAAKKRRSQNR